MKHLADLRGWRNNNPGNIKHGDQWLGLRPTQTDDAFCQFISPEYGIRAMTRILQNYYSRHKLKTIQEIINRWAPPVENDTDAYIRSVSQRLGLAENQRLPAGISHLMNPLIKAIIQHENGCQPYSDWLIDVGITWEQQGVPHRIIH